MAYDFEELIQGEPNWNEVINDNFNKIKDALESTTTSIEDTNTIIDNMKNDIINSQIPDITIYGRTLINLLGRQGSALYQNTKWEANGNTVEYDYDRFVITSVKGTSAYKYSYIDVADKLKPHTWYVLAADLYHIENGEKLTVDVSNVITKYTKSGDNDNKICYHVFKTDNSVLGLTLRALIYFNGADAVGTNCICKLRNIRLYEVSEEEVNKIPDDDMDYYIRERWNYVDDVKPVINPYIESNENLLGDISKFYVGLHGLTSGSPIWSEEVYRSDEKYLIHEILRLEPGTYNFYIDTNGNDNVKIYYHTHKYDDSFIQNVLGDFGPILEVIETAYYSFVIYDETGTLKGKDIYSRIKSGEYKVVLTKGSEHKNYEDCKNSRIIFDTKLYNKETIYKQNDGTYVKTKVWDEIDIIDMIDFSLYNPKKTSDKKRTTIPLKFPEHRYAKWLAIGYSGELLMCEYSISLNADICCDFQNCSGDIHIPNELSGWGPDYIPTHDEVRAFFLGWKMASDINSSYYNNTGNKVWAELWDGTNQISFWGTTKVVANSTVSELPTSLNRNLYKPYRLIYEHMKHLTESVNVYGNIILNNSIKSNSGFVKGEEYIVSDGLAVPSYELPMKYRVSKIYNIMNNNSINYDDMILNNRMNINAVTYGDMYINTNYKTDKVFVDYRIFENDYVNSYDYDIYSHDMYTDAIIKQMNEISRCSTNLAIVKNQITAIEKSIKQKSNPNLLINGDFKIWERGESFNETNGVCYTADRWLTYNGLTNASVTRIPNGIRITKNSSVDKPTIIDQPLDINEKILIGKTLTLSAKCNGKIHHTSIKYADKIITTYYNDDNIDLFIGKAVAFGGRLFVGVGLKKAGTLDIEWVKLEVGDEPTLFSPKSYQEELADCQRYYEVVKPFSMKGDVIHPTGISQVSYDFKVRKRVVPSMVNKNVILHYMGITKIEDCRTNLIRTSEDTACFDVHPLNTLSYETVIGRRAVIESELGFDAEIY